MQRNPTISYPSFSRVFNAEFPAKTDGPLFGLPLVVDKQLSKQSQVFLELWKVFAGPCDQDSHVQVLLTLTQMPKERSKRSLGCKASRSRDVGFVAALELAARLSCSFQSLRLATAFPDAHSSAIEER